MTRVKNTLSLFAVLFTMILSSQTIYAQPGGGGGGQMGGQNEEEEITPEQMLTSTGLFKIDVDKAMKKIKVKVKKKDTSRKEEVLSYLTKYDDQYKKILIDNAPAIDSILSETAPMMGQRGGMQQGGQQQGMQQGGQQQGGNAQQGNMRNARGQQGAMGGGKMAYIRQITNLAKPMHDELKLMMKVTLNEKESKRWNKYYLKLCEKNLFGQTQNQTIRNNSGGQSGGGQSSGGQRGGGGGGGMGGGGGF